MRIMGIVYDLIIIKNFRNLQYIGNAVGKKADKRLSRLQTLLKSSTFCPKN